MKNSVKVLAVAAVMSVAGAVDISEPSGSCVNVVQIPSMDTTEAALAPVVCVGGKLYGVQDTRNERTITFSTDMNMGCSCIKLKNLWVVDLKNVKPR